MDLQITSILDQKDLDLIKKQSNKYYHIMVNGDIISDIVIPNNVIGIIFNVMCRSISGKITFPRRLNSISFLCRIHTDFSTLNLPDNVCSLRTHGHNFLTKTNSLILPKYLKELYINNIHNVTVENMRLPHTLRILEFGWQFNQKLDDFIFPPNLEIIDFGFEFNHSLENVRLPDSIRTMNISGKYSHLVEKIKFPKNLELLKLYSVNIPSYIPEVENLEIDNTIIPLVMNYVNPTVKNIYLLKEQDTYDNIKMPYECKLIIIDKIEF